MSPNIIKIINILPTKVWIENGLCGERHVMIQHESCEPFTYATFNYNYAYTSNNSTFSEAEELAVRLGATKPVEIRSREMKWPTIEDAKQQLIDIQKFIFDEEKRQNIKNQSVAFSDRCDKHPLQIKPCQK